MKLYQIDAFANRIFEGNPAAVCPLEEWLDDELMQNIAIENNLSETAFFVKKDDGNYSIRWFTPNSEVDLCGHATLASAYLIFDILKTEENEVRFDSRSGELIVTKEGELITLNFPVRIVEKKEAPDSLLEAMGLEPGEVYFNKSFLFVYKSEDEVRSIAPDFNKMLETKTHGVIVTAPGKNCDFVSRFFVPDVGVNEDPVTGYAHTILTPFWSKKLGRKKLKAFQASKRGGELFCEDLGERVKISGKAKLYMVGEIELM